MEEGMLVTRQELQIEFLSLATRSAAHQQPTPFRRRVSKNATTKHRRPWGGSDSSDLSHSHDQT